MRKLHFTALADAALNRLGSFFVNILLRRMAKDVAASDAVDIAAVEERIEQLQEQNRPLAAKRLAAHLAQFAGDDPTYELTTCFGRQLLADSLDEVETPALRAEVEDDAQATTRRGRPKARPSARHSQTSN